MGMVRRFWEWVNPGSVPEGHCWSCRAPYVHEQRTLVFGEQFGIPDRVATVEVCSACGKGGSIVEMPAPDSAPPFEWRQVGDPWVEPRG